MSAITVWCSDVEDYADATMTPNGPKCSNCGSTEHQELV